MELFFLLILNEFLMWNWYFEFYLKKEEIVLVYLRRIGVGMWFCKKKKVNEWEVFFGLCVSK